MFNIFKNPLEFYLSLILMNIRVFVGYQVLVTLESDINNIMRMFTTEHFIKTQSCVLNAIKEDI